MAGAKDKTGTSTSSPWNRLEVAKLLVTTSTTVAIFIVGFLLQDQQADLARQREQNVRKEARESAEYSNLLAKRAALWAEMGPLLAGAQRLLHEGHLSPADVTTLSQLEDSYLKKNIAFQLYFTERFAAAFDGYDELVEKVVRSGGRQVPPASISWGRYKCLRRAAAKDMGLLVDPEMVALETARGPGTGTEAWLDEKLGCAGNDQ